MHILTRKKLKGVTLLEVMLVLVIASSLLVMVLNYTTQKADELRRDRTVMQAQQILNAGLSYYITHSAWPIVGAPDQCSLSGRPSWSPMHELQPDYLPDSLDNNPYGQPYHITCANAANGGGFYVAIAVNNAANAAAIAGRLPLAYRSNSFADWPPKACTSGDDCIFVIANVNIPGQNLNNARSVNFASTYFSGSCVPAPNCPPNMKPEIMVMPAAVSGVNDAPSCTQQQICARNPEGIYKCREVTACKGKVNSISSFTATALGDASGSPVDPKVGPYSCSLRIVPQACIANQAGDPLPSDGTLYWRVCLNVSTDRGEVNPSNTTDPIIAAQQGKMMGSLIAFTRCVPNMGDENPSGSIDVWQN